MVTTTHPPITLKPTNTSEVDSQSAIETPVDIRVVPVDEPTIDNDVYRHLRLAFTEENEKYEYTLRYNSSRRGFWLASPPYERMF